MKNRDRYSVLTGLSAGIAGALVATLLLTVIPAGANNGDPVVLGEVNKAIRSTWMASRGPSVLKLSNTLNGTAVELKTAAHVPPMIVHSSVKVEGLNVDLLDGLDSSAFATAAHDHDATYAAIGHDHDADYLAIDGKADDADLLDGNDSTAFAAAGHHHDAAYLAIDGKADDSDLLDGLDSGAFRGSACGPNTTEVGRSRHGPICSSPFGTVTIDNSASVGEHVSLVLDAAGNPVITYYDTTTDDLKIAYCSDPTCTTAPAINTVDSTADVGKWNSLVLDANGYPVISYKDETSDDVMLAHCTDPDCSDPPNINDADDIGSEVTGDYTSLTLDANGYPVISYYTVASGGVLRLAHCSDADCAGTVTITGVNGGWTGEYTSLVLDADGYPVISYHHVNSSDLRLAHCDDADCTSTSIETVASAGVIGRDTSLALDASGFPVIAYRDATNAELELVHCNDPDCTGGDETSTVVDNCGGEISMVLDQRGYPVIAYYDNVNGDLKVAQCDDADCAVPRVTVVDSTGNVGDHLALTLDASGNPVIAYHDATNTSLKLAVLTG